MRYRTHAPSSKHGFLKTLLVNGGRIHGFTGFCPGAGETMSSVQIAIAGEPNTALRKAILGYLALAEELHSLVKSVRSAPSD
jgi:pyruvate/2-oxoglutarate dehydrogenase complex dihydrolipoamide dehydrogenase (E3) component